eukprot:212466-Rhodomonas_salina.1
MVVGGTGGVRACVPRRTSPTAIDALLLREPHSTAVPVTEHACFAASPLHTLNAAAHGHTVCRCGFCGTRARDRGGPHQNIMVHGNQ